MSVKPELIALFQQYLLPLGPSLRLCSKAMLASVLPGLEDEEHSERGAALVLSLVDGIHMAVSSRVFFSALSLALLEAPNLRLPGILYLRKRFPRLVTRHELVQLVGDPALFVSAVEACLGDTTLLAQREAMELLITAFPLTALSTRDALNEDEVVALVAASLQALLRRELSLTRRVYAWLLGTSESSVVRASWLPLVTAALRRDLARAPTDAAAAARPYRVLVSLLDRPDEVGLPVCNALLPDALAAGRRTRDMFGQEVRAP